MIDCKDLRVGNWVYDGKRTQFPMYVRAVGEDYVYLDFEGNESDLWESEPKDLEGILITEELLKKVGFDQSCEIFYFNGFELTSTEFGYVPSVNLCEYYIGNPIFYVHELQNLYQCLIRKELKIEL